MAGGAWPRNRWNWRCWHDCSRIHLDRRYGVRPTQSHVVTELDCAEKVPLRDVATWRGYVNIASTLGRSAGGPMGGYLADTIGWRW